MAQTNLAKLVVKLEAQSAKLTSELEKANKRAKKWESKTKKSVNNVKGAFAALGVGIAAIKFKNFVQDQIAYADAIGKTADKLGVSTKALQTYRFAASQSGVENTVLEKGLQNMVRNLADFGNGIGEAKAELEAMGFTQQQLMRMNPDQQFAAIADRLREIENNTERVNTAYKIFGGRATALLNITRDGSEGMKAYGEQAQAAGLILEDSMIRNAEEANNRMDVLSKTLSTKLTAAVIDNAKEIEGLTESLIDFVNVAAQAPRFVRFLSESFAAMVHGPADLVRIDDRINKLRTSINQMSASLLLKQETAGKGGMFGRWLSGAINDSDFENIQKLGVELTELIEKRDALTLAAPAPLTLTGANGDDPAESPEVLAKQERDNVILEMEYELQDKLLAVREEKAKQYADIQKNVENQVATFRQNSMNHAVNLLSALGAKSKVFAAAAILLEKGIAIQRVLIQSKVAAMAALTPPPIGLGPVAGQGLSASIISSGYASAGFIGATGAVQLASLGDNGGGASVGTSTAETSAQLDTALERQGTFPTDININITGLGSQEVTESVVESIRELFLDGGRQFV